MGTVQEINEYGKINTSFSGADIVATITPMGGKPVVFAEIQTISYSTYRPTMPVQTLGRVTPSGFVRGPRTVAGSIIFTVFDRHVLQNVFNSIDDASKKEKGKCWNLGDEELANMRDNMKADDLPPFDINITFMNEYGNKAYMNIYGVVIISEGQTMSIEDMFTENTMQYIATDIQQMKQNGNHYY